MGLSTPTEGRGVADDVPSAVFLDRDGTINQRLAGYVTTSAELRLLPQAATAIRRLNDLEIPVIVVTNQRGIALGLMSEDDLAEIHDELARRLAEAAGARINAFFYCPHDRDQCDCRKPNVGLFVQAQRQFLTIDLATAVTVGDSPTDVEAAHRAGMAAIRIGAEAGSLGEAVDQLLDH